MIAGKSFNMDTITSNTLVIYFQHLYRETDHKMSLLKPVCKRGCPWCCYQSVEILNWEEPLISQFLREKINGEVKRNIKKELENWFDFFDRVTTGKNELTMHDAFDFLNKQQAKERFPCPFLTNNECSIYRVRPLSCRCHINTNSPVKCKKNPLNDSTTESTRYRKEIIAEIISKVPTTLQLLNFVSASHFELNHRIKPIIYSKIETIG
jgi:Fe-S-cluster containining protein